MNSAQKAHTQKMASIDQLLDELIHTKQSMAIQNQTISEIINVSNDILLQVEGMPKPLGPSDDSKVVRWRKETMQALIDVMERIQGVVGVGTTSPQSPTALNIAGNQNKRIEFLCMSVRKLLATFNIIESTAESLDCCYNEDDQIGEENESF